MQKRIRLDHLWGLIPVVFFVINCAQENGQGILPDSLNGLALREKISGEAASKFIKRLHGKNVAPLESYIGYYGSNSNEAVLYISSFTSRKKARRVLERMSDLIGEGRGGFGHHQKFRVNENEIHQVLGQGQIQYFFVKAQYVYWLAIPPDIAREGLAQLLQIDVDDIPSLHNVLKDFLPQL